MKKIYAFVAAVFIFTSSVFSQQFADYSNTGILYKHDGSIRMDVIGNPVKGVITLQINNPVTTKYELSLFTETGRKVTTVLYDHPAGVSTEKISVSTLQTGYYFLVAVTNFGRQTIKLFIE